MFSFTQLDPEYSLEGLMLKLQYFGHLMWRADSWEKTLMLGKTEDKRRREQQKMRWLDSITDSMDMNLSKLQETVEDGGAWCVAVHEVAKCWTQLSDWTTTILLGSIGKGGDTFLQGPWMPCFCSSKYETYKEWNTWCHVKSRQRSNISLTCELWATGCICQLSRT